MNVASTIAEVVLLLSICGFASYVALGDFPRQWFSVYVNCHDQQYRKPFVPPHHHAVPYQWLYLSVLIIIPCLIFTIHMLLHVTFSKPKHRSKEEKKYKKGLWEVYNVLALYYSGIFFLILLCKISHLIGGSPAPFFATLCSPDCTNGTADYRDPVTKRDYVTQNSCPESVRNLTGPDTFASFPSVHSSLSFYAAIFVTAFYCTTGTTSYTRLLQPSLAAFLIILAIVTSLSRVTQYTNHVQDVVGGAILGSIASLFQVCIAGDHRKVQETKADTSVGTRQIVQD